MLELGEHGPALHAACGKAAAEAGLDLVVGVRGNAEHWPRLPAPAELPSLFLPDAEAAGQWLRAESAARRRGAGEGLARRPSGTRHRNVKNQTAIASEDQ